MPKRKTKTEFLSDLRNVFGDKYNYSKVNYINSKEKVVIICPEHGEFLKSPNKLLRGQGCRVCSGLIPLTQKSFIERAIKKHNGKYDYSNSIIKTSKEKVEINCPKHGSFFQLPMSHLSGQGCSKCGVESSKKKQRFTKSEFISAAKKKHGSKYNYSKVKYLNNKSKIEITCPIHGSFLIKANNHLSGQGCPKCGRVKANQNITLDYKTFLNRAREVHGETYTYIEDSYKNYTSKMVIICSNHGEFYQTPHSHISMKSGCPKCGYLSSSEKNSLEWETVKEMFRTVHGKKYKYKKRTFINVSHKMIMVCPEHGKFEQKPYLHYGGSGCLKCGTQQAHKKLKLSFNDFLQLAKSKHGNKFDYTNANYIDIYTPINIICKKHGEFVQVPRDHYRGSGCPKCNSSRGEREVRKVLKKMKLYFKEQETFDGLVYKAALKCDFYIPSLKTVIEYNGLQHYEPISLFGGEVGLKETQLRDKVKYNFLRENGYNLIIVRFDSANIEEELFEKLTELKKVNE